MRPIDSGFTLIEVLVAFTIAAMSLTLLLRIQSNSATTVVTAQEYLTATELAKSLIDESSVTVSSLSFSRSGRFEKYTWAVDAGEYVNRGVRPVDSAGSAALDTGAALLALREIAVKVTWPSRNRPEQFELRTVRPYSVVPDDVEL